MRYSEWNPDKLSSSAHGEYHDSSKVGGILMVAIQFILLLAFSLPCDITWLFFNIDAGNGRLFSDPSHYPRLSATATAFVIILTVSKVRVMPHHRFRFLAQTSS
jgi:hypothetical protein